MQAPPVFRRFKKRLTAGGAMTSDTLSRLFSLVLFSCSVLDLINRMSAPTKLFYARETHKITSNVLNCSDSIGCEGFSTFRIMELDPVSAIGFSPIQGIVSQFDKSIDGKGVLLRKTCNP